MKFRLFIAIACSFILSSAQAQDDATAGLKALNHFVGNWNTEMTAKPSKWMPEGSKGTVKEHTSWILKDRFIQGREIRHPDGEKSMWFITYDPKSNSYPMWFFNSTGVLGGEWSGTWDEATKTLTSKSTDSPLGWTSQGTNHFPDNTSVRSAAWMKDDTGTLLLDMAWKKTRQPVDAAETTLAAWSEIERSAEMSPEFKIMERLIGKWNTIAVSKPAEWTPKEERTTSKITRKWILNGQFMQDTSDVLEGPEGLSLMTFDPVMKKYRGWWFNSEGHRNKSIGNWDAKTETISFRADLEDGLVSQSSVKFIDEDRHVWKVVVKDGDGKLYFDTEWTVTRQKE